MNIAEIPQVQNLNKEEMSVFLDIIKDSMVFNNLESLGNLWSVDYTEKPVTIDEFLRDDHYMGKVFSNGNLVYPYWKVFLHKLFHDNPDNKFECAITGAIGCVTGDTKVRLLDNRILTIKEMAESDEKDFWVYSWDRLEDCWKPGLATNVHKSGVNTEVIKVNLTEDLSVTVTPNHPFLLTSGVYVEAKDLKPGDSIQSLYLYESNSKFYNGYLCFENDKPVHRRVAECIYNDVEYTKDVNVHHINHNKKNNDPRNLQVLKASEHLKHHRDEYWSDTENHKKRSEQMSLQMLKYKSKLMLDAKYGESWVESDTRKVLVSKTINYNKYNHPNLRKDITIDKVTDAAHKLNTTTTYKIANYLGCSKTKVENVIYYAYGNKLNWIDDNNLPISESKRAKLRNHTVLSIEYVHNQDVYDLTVDGYHNYGIADSKGNLIFTHNTGKTTVAAIALLYCLYRTMCLKDPQKFYGLTQNSPIVFACMNLSLDLVYKSLYSMIVEAIRMSPWFCERVDIRGRYDYSVEFPNNIQLSCCSQTQHFIGKNILFAILDECNFSNAPKGSKNSVMDMYRSARRRLESRFLKQGRIPGFIFLVSSKNSDQDFLDQYIQSIKGSKTTWVIDEPVWIIKPANTYTGETFQVAVGDKTKSSRIIKDEEDYKLAKKQGYKIINVPIEYKTAFQQDINDALKDIAGISSVATNKLIPYAGKIESVINYKKKSPFMMHEIILGLESEEDIKDYIDDLRLLKKDIHIPRFIHCDIGLKGDGLGLSMVHADSKTSVERYTKEGKIESIVENKYVADFMIMVRPTSGSEVPLFKIREFIIWLATTLGLKLQLVTFDGFQSADSIQLLKVAGINAGLQSVDRTADPYLNLRSCILEDRLELYDNPIIIEELYDLEYDRNANKVDHTLEGHKDCADSLCGALWGAQNYYATNKQANIVQHQRVDEAVKYIAELNKKRWVQDLGNKEDSWLFKD